MITTIFRCVSETTPVLNNGPDIGIILFIISGIVIGFFGLMAIDIIKNIKELKR